MTAEIPPSEEPQMEIHKPKPIRNWREWRYWRKADMGLTRAEGQIR